MTRTSGSSDSFSVLLLSLVLLCAQAFWVLHELEHGLEGGSEACVLCLHASHDGDALVSTTTISAQSPPGIFNHNPPRHSAPGISPRSAVARAPPRISAI